MDPQKSAKKPVQRSRLTLGDKYKLIKDHENKVGIEDLKKKYKCGKTAVYDIIKNKSKILDEYLSVQNVDVKNKQRHSKFEKVNELTFDWLTQALSKNLPVSGTLLQEKAKGIAYENGFNEFKASNGWLEAFKQRHKLTFSVVCGDSNDVEQAPVDNFLDLLPDLIAGYKPEDIANCDETAFFFRAIPKKTLHKKGEKCFGGKHSKERLTVLLCCFADGTFLKPLVIGKSENPRCFKNIKKQNLPVSWYANKKAWMTASLMEEWLIQLNEKMVIQKRNILLFMDNATSHPNLNLTNIQLRFLPLRTTSKLQPLDQGIINAVKVHYRK